MTPYILSNRFHIQVVSDLSEATFLVAGMGYLTALTRYDLRGHLDHIERNLIEKWFQTFPMRIGRFHQT